ncbi:fluoride efflux transporter CrcB [Tranquillimonas alkanivorans]|uniref:Fluoride-specific ion channel FluC n=1 Tax=Tranquillimonas alkanivorans TaxID=441119 RepID=A0A1I5SWX6_9RHOB|nr:fluoride efflux transporter CrcB [Tranquillimonas alkanivorans]SFP75285.1 camphor resistance protein CrcB [Tranquillimonas alkanivorans]
MISTVLQVALGGAVGASARYLTGIGVVRLFGHGFPLGILTVNVLGSFLMGIFVSLAAQRGLTHLSPLVMTGFLGGFTTFSSFSLDTITLIERGQVAAALLYVGLSVVVSLAALAAGMVLTRGAFA